MSRKKAVPLLNISGELSAKEFQEKLSKWFEERGLLSHLRTHLRSQMVAALKDTSLQFQPKQNISPKYHAVSLLIAEYLLCQEYHYTLSVFTSEVPLIKHLSEALPTDDDSEEPPRFQRQDVSDILECLGFNNMSHNIGKICHLYLNNSEPLLICIMRVLLNTMCDTMNKEAGPSGSRSVRYDREKEQEYDSDDCIFSRKIKNLADKQIKAEDIEQLKDEMMRFHEAELERISSEEEKKCLDKLAEIEKKHQEDLERREIQFRNELVEREERIQSDMLLRETEMQQKIQDAEQQRENMDEELRFKQQQITELAAQILEHRREADIRLAQLEERGTFLRQQEEALQETGQRLAERNAELDSKEHQIVQKLKMLEEEEKAVLLQRKETEDEHESTKYSNKSKSKTQLVRDLQRKCLELRKGLNAARQRQEKSDNREDKLFQEQLLQENAELKGHINQLRLRNIELTTHAANLAREYEDAQVTITLLSAHPPTSEHPLSVPPPAFPGSIGELGAEGPSRHLRSRQHRHLRRLSGHGSGSSSESSPTEDIIRESRVRLRRLEEESEAVDRSYREFRLRTSSSLLQSVSSPSQWKDLNSPPAFNYSLQKDGQYQGSDLYSIPNMIKNNIYRRSDIFSSSNSDANLSQERYVTFDDSLKIIDNQIEISETVQVPVTLTETVDEIQSQQIRNVEKRPKTIASEENSSVTKEVPSVNNLNGNSHILPPTFRMAPLIAEHHTENSGEDLLEVSSFTVAIDKMQSQNNVEITQRIHSYHLNDSESNSKHSEIQTDVPTNIKPSENKVQSKPVSADSDKSKTLDNAVSYVFPSTSQQPPIKSVTTNNTYHVTDAVERISPPSERKVDDILSSSSNEQVSSDHRLSVGESNKDDDDFW